MFGFFTAFQIEVVGVLSVFYTEIKQLRRESLFRLAGGRWPRVILDPLHPSITGSG